MLWVSGLAKFKLKTVDKENFLNHNVWIERKKKVSRADRNLDRFHVIRTITGKYYYLGSIETVRAFIRECINCCAKLLMNL